MRRALRVFPAYYLVLTLAIFWYADFRFPFASFHLAMGDWEANAGERLAERPSYLMNYTYGAGQPNPMSWAWSLCVEEHFYLLLPPALVVLYRSRSSRLRIAALGGDDDPATARARPAVLGEP